MSYSDLKQEKYIPNDFLEAMKLLFSNDKIILEQIFTQYNRTRKPLNNDSKLYGDLINDLSKNNSKINKLLKELNLNS